MLFKMFLEAPDVHQIVSCGRGQEYGIHRIQVYKVLDFIHHEDFISLTIISQAINNLSSCVSNCLIAALEEGNLFCARNNYMFLQ